TYTIRNGDNLERIGKTNSVTWELLSRINNISNPGRIRLNQTIKVLKGPFHAVVDKKKFTMDVYLGAPGGGPGSVYVATLPVGLGRDDSTPTGVWTVTPGQKQKNPKFWGTADLPPREPDDPENPLGEFWIALTGTEGGALGQEGYGVHGTIEPDSIGQMASHGCIRMRDEDIKLVYELMVDGKSTVTVK
ncbi:MAG: L,D-transpeptidase family protein, partial [Tepidisphaeraceae bacterium]